MTTETQTISFGLLLIPGFQWLDAAEAVDSINNHSHAMMSVLQAPADVAAKAPIMTWSYISNDLKHVQATSGPPQPPTETYETCPKLDYLIIPGPDITKPLPDGCAEFLKSRFEGLKGLITICTGSIAVAPTGILDGYQVCSNKMALKIFAQLGALRKEVKWVGDRRWMVDGKVWSAAGVTAGLDLAAEFARVNFDEDVVKLTRDVMEYQANPAQPDQYAKLLEGIQLN